MPKTCYSFSTITGPTIMGSIIIGLASLTLANSAFAAEQDDADSRYSPLSSLYSCIEITNSTERLACYDTKVANLHTAEQNNEVVAIDAKAARKIKREAFGFNIPSLPKLSFPKLGSDEKIDVLFADVQSVRKSGRKYIITLKNGQVWQEVSGQFGYIPKGDLKAKIRPKSLGSFKMTLSNDKSTVRGLRVRRIK